MSRNLKKNKTLARPSKAQVQEPVLKADSHEKPRVSPYSEVGERVLSSHTVGHRKVLPKFHPGVKLKVLVPELLHLQSA